jgi:exopolysaccharide biosynthesis predicted pyruvyltransferase EpsI
VVHMVVYTHEYASQPPVSGRGRRTNDALTVERSLEASRQAISRVRHEIDKVLTPRLPGKECALLDFPRCSNAGDSAIRMGEQILLSKLGVKPAYVCTTEKSRLECNGKAIGPGGTIYIHGGGNFDDERFNCNVLLCPDVAFCIGPHWTCCSLT